jgi:uncharacterized membrane protein
LSGYVAEHSAYHHGEISLCQTVVTMAQNFVMNYMIEKGWSLSFNITQNSWDKKWSVMFYETKEE